MSENNLTATEAMTALDLRITLARKRLARLERERDRETTRRLRRLLQDRATDSIGDRLVHRLDDLIATAERRLAELEAERATAMLKTIDALFPEAEV